MPRFPLAALIALAVAGCGGDSSQDEHQSLVDQAAAKQSQAAALGVPTPCNSDAQCGVLTFQEPSGKCLNPSYQAYSLVSASAGAASAAAADEATLAEQAVAAAPSGACPQALQRPPSATCAVNTCQLTN